MGNFLSGKDGEVTVGATAINVTGWNFDQEVDTLETTHSGSDGLEEHITGIKRASGSFTANWDTEAPASTNPPDLNIGSTLTSMKLYMEASGDYIAIPLATVTSVPIVSEVKGLVSYTCNFKVNGSGGAWTFETA